MFERWHDYYLMLGSCAAALIGLMFVVMTLTAGHDRNQAEQGKHLYSSPIVLHLAVVLALSGAALVPDMAAPTFGIGVAAVALFGLGLGVRSAVGIARWSGAPSSGFDMFWYGAAPAIVYAGLLASAFGIFRGAGWASIAVAADLMVLMLVSIHAEWDLVTFLAPVAKQED